MTFRRPAHLILDAVAYLRRSGFERIRIVPGLSASGADWRIAVTTADNVDDSILPPVFLNRGEVVRYSDAQGADLGDLTIDADTEESQVAQWLMERLPEDRARGVDSAYARWFSDLLAQLDPGAVPVCYWDSYSPIYWRLTSSDDPIEVPPPSQREWPDRTNRV